MGDVLLCLQVVAHLLTFGAVALWYSDPTARYRPGVSILATLIAGSSLASAVFAVMAGRGAGAFETVLLVALCLLVLCARGNVARLLPRQPWSRSA